MSYIYEHRSLALAIDSIFFVKHVILNKYREANVRILSSLNDWLQGVLDLTPMLYEYKGF
jgi:hypothetical protein